MAWTYLIVAGLFEIAWAMGMKFTDGFSKLWPTVAVLALMGLSVYFLSLAVKTLPVGTAYAVWTGIGIAGTSILGMVWFDEPVSLIRLVLIFLILASVVGLKLLPQ
jgi:quaternary ammonium compound-resistance protein SugE